MADTPAVSVITSVYDGMPYLAESIRSILAQRFSDFEYLIVDDGSTDDSWETLQAFAAADRRIRLLRNPANWGFARSQNRALELAGGRYVACQDQDDLSHPDRLARQVEFLDSNPQVGVVGTWPHFIDPNGDTLDNGRYPLLAGNGSIQERLLVGFGMIGPSIVVRRPLLTAVAGYDPDSPAAEDYDLILRLSEITQLANVPEGLYRYRLHPDSVSSRRASLQAHSMAQARERALRRRFGDSAPAELTAVAARTYLRSALLQLATGTGPEAGPSIDRALALHPQLIDDGSLIDSEVERFTRTLSPSDQARLLRRLFGDLLPQTHSLAGLHRKLLSKARRTRLFAAGSPSDSPSFWPDFLAVVRLEPAWLLNRGLWALAVRDLRHRLSLRGSERRRAPAIGTPRYPAEPAAPGTAGGTERRAQ